MIELLLLAFFGIADDEITFSMEVWVNETRSVKMAIVNYDIPDYAGYYSPAHDQIVIEEKSLRPTMLTRNGKCVSVLWHEILHAKWGAGSAIEHHLRMKQEGQCA